MLSLSIHERTHKFQLEELDDFPNKICIECHNRFYGFVEYLKNVFNAQSKIKDLVSGRNIKIEIEQYPVDEEKSAKSIVATEIAGDPLAAEICEVFVKVEPPDEDLQNPTKSDSNIKDQEQRCKDCGFSCKNHLSLADLDKYDDDQKIRVRKIKVRKRKKKTEKIIVATSSRQKIHFANTC